MQNRSFSARRIIITEKPGRLSDFSSVQSCGSQPEQNETDEPPSLFMPLNAGIGLCRLQRITTHPFSFFNSGTLLLSKTEILKAWNFFFAEMPGRVKKEPVYCGYDPV
jgi:hypothetical protein